MSLSATHCQSCSSPFMRQHKAEFRTCGCHRFMPRFTKVWDRIVCVRVSLSLFTRFTSFLLLFCYSCPNFSPFVLLCPAHPHSHWQSPPLCPCSCSLTSPFPFFPLLCPPPTLATVSLFHVSMSLVLFCSLVPQKKKN